MKRYDNVIRAKLRKAEIKVSKWNQWHDVGEGVEVKQEYDSVVIWCNQLYTKKEIENIVKDVNCRIIILGCKEKEIKNIELTSKQFLDAILYINSSKIYSNFASVNSSEIQKYFNIYSALELESYMIRKIAHHLVLKDYISCNRFGDNPMQWEFSLEPKGLKVALGFNNTIKNNQEIKAYRQGNKLITRTPIGNIVCDMDE